MKFSHVARRLLFILIVGSSTHLNVTAQPKYALATEKGIWVPFSVKSQQYGSGQHYGYTIAEQQKMFSNISAVMELVHKTAFFNPPRGYEVKVYTTLCTDGCTPGKAISGMSGMIIREYYRYNGEEKVQLAGEGPSLKVYFNNIDILLTRTPSSVDDYFEEPAIVDTFQGFPVYEGGFVVVSNRNTPLFKPVTKEYVLKLQIRESEKSFQEIKNSLSGPSPYQEFLASKQESLNAMLEGNKWLAKTDPEKAKLEKEKIYAGMARMDSTLKAQDARVMLERQEMIDRSGSELKALKSKLANMSTAERMEAERSPNGRRMVQADLSFYDQELPVSSIQLIVFDLLRYDLKRVHSSDLAKDAIRKIRETIELKVLLASAQH